MQHSVLNIENDFPGKFGINTCSMPDDRTSKWTMASR